MEKTRGLLQRFASPDARDCALASRLMFFIPLGIDLAYRIVFASSSFAAYAPEWIALDHIRLLCYITLIVRELLFGKWDRMAFLGLVMFSGMAYSAFLGNWAILVDGIAFAFAARNVPFRSIALFACVAIGALSAFVILSALTGSIPDHTIDGRNMKRHYLGFGWPNTPSAFVMFTSLLYLYLRSEKLRIVEAVALLTLAGILYSLTGCRAVLIVSAIAVGSAMAVKRIPEGALLSKPFMVASVGAVVICFAAMMALSVAYDPSSPAMASIDELFSGRISLAHNALMEHQLQLFGQRIDIVGASSYNLRTGEWVVRQNANPLDCAYVRMTLQCGVLFTALFLVMATAVAVRAYRERQWLLLICIGCIALYGCMEAVPLYFTFNPFLLLAGSLFLHKVGSSS